MDFRIKNKKKTMKKILNWLFGYLPVNNSENILM